MNTIKRLKPVHFPASFPEVFTRDTPGFDCLIGNPPWEKVVVDREVWWGMHLPGVRSLPVARRRSRIDTLEASRPDLSEQFLHEQENAKALKQILRSTFPRLGSGQTDLHKAFAWANWALCRQGGTIGIVLPRTAVADAGMAKWRREIIAGGGGGEGESSYLSGDAHQPQGVGVRKRPQLLHSGSGRDHPLITVATCLNTKQWVFDGVHGRYTVTLVAVRKKQNLRTQPGRWL